MMTDPIADMLTQIRNALSVRKDTVEMPGSKEREGIADVLKREGYIADYQMVDTGSHSLLKIYLKYGPLDEQLIREVERVSKPGRRIYKGVDELPLVANGMGIAVVSTSKGLLSDGECRQENVGGEIVCTVK